MQAEEGRIPPAPDDSDDGVLAHHVEKAGNVALAERGIGVFHQLDVRVAHCFLRAVRLTGPYERALRAA